MKKTLFNQPSIYLFVLILLGCFISCRKEPSSFTPPGSTSKRLSDADSLKYLMYNIMQVSFLDNGRDTILDLPTYYWYAKVPKLNPFSAKYDSADVLLANMKTYAINAATGKPYDKYSFLDHGEVAGQIQQGVAGDLGM